MQLTTIVANKRRSISNVIILKDYINLESAQLLNYFFREIKFDLYSLIQSENRDRMPIIIRKHPEIPTIEIHVDEDERFFIIIDTRDNTRIMCKYSNDIYFPFNFQDKMYDFESGFNYILDKIREIWQ